MKTLVTGATGFLGSALVRQLLARGVDIRILRRSKSKLDLLGPAAQSIEHVIGDITDADAVQEAVNGVDHLYHVAGFVAIVARKRWIVRKMRSVNVKGTANVVEAALASGIKRLVHTSSIAALGREEGAHGMADESAVWSPSRITTAYAATKHDAELHIYRGIAEGLDAVIVNPTVIFGPGRRGENTLMIFEAVKSGWVRRAPAGGANVVDVEDVAAGHILAMQQGRTGERYILGGENLAWASILAQMAEAAGVPPARGVLPLRQALGAATLLQCAAAMAGKNPALDRTTVRGMYHLWRISSEKAVRELGYRPRPFAQTVQRMAAARLS